MNEEIKEHISSLINNFNNMTYEEQQEELLELYKACEIDYVNIVERHSNLAKQKRQLQNNWNKLKDWLEERKFVYNITGEDLDEDTSITEVLDKMKELEKGDVK